MNDQPLVSVICLCHNQGDFVSQAIQSALDQDYQNIELIVVDDASTDNSTIVIGKLLEMYDFQFISHPNHIGNCRAFNTGFHASTGAFIIDLAADDVLYANRISEGLRSFADSKIGVNFCDAMLIDESDEPLKTHYKRDSSGKLLTKVPQGDVYVDLIQSYFISPPTMMIRRSVLEDLSGYDENLAYEDFDFWIRSSRNWKYSFTDKVLVNKRILKKAHSKKQFKLFSTHQNSTLEVCRKIRKLNRTPEENQALKKRCWYEIRQCLRQGNWHLIPSFFALIK